MPYRANRTAPRLLFLAGGLLLAGLLLVGCGGQSFSTEQRDFEPRSAAQWSAAIAVAWS